MGRKKLIDTEKILDAAEAVVAKFGAHKLSLNLVAAEAGISKGGLTYSFPTRNALLKAVADRDFARYQASVQHIMQGQREKQSKLAAHIEVMRSSSPILEARAFSTMAALTQDPDGLREYRQCYTEYYQDYADSSDPASVVMFLALEGLLMLRGSGVIEWSDQEWDRTLDNISAICVK